MDIKPLQPNEKLPSKLPIQRPPMWGSKMPMNNGKGGGARPGSNFVKPVRTMRASKGR